MGPFPDPSSWGSLRAGTSGSPWHLQVALGFELGLALSGKLLEATEPWSALLFAFVLSSVCPHLYFHN